MSDAVLTLTDFYLLRSLFLNEPVPWTTDALSRCYRAGYIVRDGARLTPEGVDRASVFNAYVQALWRGVPLETVRNPLSPFAEQYEPWHRYRMRNNEQYQFSPHTLLFSDGPLPLQYARHKKREMRDLLEEWRLKVESKDWERWVPYAYQMEPKPDGFRVICFKGLAHSKMPDGFNYVHISPSRPPNILRIQAQYYDYVTERFSEVEWWGRKAKNKTNEELAARMPRGKQYLGNGFAALVRLVRTANWPIPLYDVSKVTVKEKREKKREPMGGQA